MKQRQQTLDAIQSNNDSYIARLDENLQQIYTANLHIIEQNFLRDLAVIYPYLSTYDKSVRVNLLREQLSSLCASSPLLESAHAYLFNYNLMYNSDNYPIGSYCTLNEEETRFYQELSKTHGLVEYYESPLEKRKTLSVFMAPFSSSPAFAVNFILSENALKSYLESNSSYSDEFYLFEIENGFSLSNLPSDLRKEASNFLKPECTYICSFLSKVNYNWKIYTCISQPDGILERYLCTADFRHLAPSIDPLQLWSALFVLLVWFSI